LSYRYKHQDIHFHNSQYHIGHELYKFDHDKVNDSSGDTHNHEYWLAGHKHEYRFASHNHEY